jgi:sporulation protein YlmC with PRC-barrel domain
MRSHQPTEEKRGVIMRVDLGARAITSDGEEVGHVKHLVLDPITTELRTAVVEHGHLNRESRMVPIASISSATEEQIQLDITRDEFEGLPEFVQADYTAPPPGYTIPFSYPGGGLLWPLGYAGPAVANRGQMENEAYERTEELREQNLENAVIDTDSDVISRDGEKIGEVEQLEFDSATGKPSRLIIRKGFLLTKSLDVPLSAIASVDDGAVVLNLSKDEALKIATSVEDR